MVCPKRHIRFLEQLTDEEMLDLLKSVTRAKRLLDKTLKPQGYNIGINISDVAGAGIKNHLHIHLVPRWKGDTNFMPVLGNTKVISQSLQELLKILRAAQRKEEGR
jgi:ATP adenylyltransferase